MEKNKTELIDLYKKLMQEKSPECESEFFKELNGTILWVPNLAEEQEENRKTFALLMTADERKFVPAFLHKKSNLGRFKEEQLVEIPYNKLKYLIIDAGAEISGIVIAPFEENIVFDRKLIEIIDAQTMGMSLCREEHVGRIKLRKPENVPNGLIDVLKQFFETSLKIESAWIIKAKAENESDEHWMLLIDFYGEKTELFPQVAEIMKPYMKQGEKFELVQKSKDFDTKQIEPAKIYTRINNNKQ